MKKEEIIYKIVNESPVPLSTDRIYNMLPHNIFSSTSRDYVKTALNRLVDKGRIKRVRQGVYASPGVYRTIEKSIKKARRVRRAHRRATIILYRGVEMIEEVVGEDGKISLPKEWAGRTVKIVLF